MGVRQCGLGWAQTRTKQQPAMLSNTHLKGLLEVTAHLVLDGADNVVRGDLAVLVEGCAQLWITAEGNHLQAHEVEQEQEVGGEEGKGKKGREMKNGG